MQESFRNVSNFYDQLLNGATNFQGIDLTGANLERLIISQFCDLSHASFRNAKLTNARLPKILMESAICDQADLKNALLKNGKFRNASFCGANLTGANLFDADLTGANLSDAILNDCNLRGANLQGANLKGAHLENADLQGARYSINTYVDGNLNLTDLGMTMINAQSSQAGDVSEDVDQTVILERPSDKKQKELYYRGNKVELPDQEEPQEEPQEEEEVILKEIWYRGARSVIEVKRSRHSNQTGLNYRGVKH